MDLQAMKSHANEGLPFRISLEAANKGVGLVALGLPLALLLVSALGQTCTGIDSISHYYFTRLGGDIFVGALCLIGVLLTFFYKLPPTQDGMRPMVDGYLGHQILDIWLARFAGICAFGVALAPTKGKGCEDFDGAVTRVFLEKTKGGHALQGPEEMVKGNPSFEFWPTLGVDQGLLTMTHYGAALGMFLVLAWYSLVVFPRPQSATAFATTGDQEYSKKRRNLCYRVFGGLILISIIALIYKFAFIEETRLARWNAYNLTFWFEALGLTAFGLSWCLKGRLFSRFRDDQESDPKTLGN